MVLSSPTQTLSSRPKHRAFAVRSGETCFFFCRCLATRRRYRQSGRNGHRFGHSGLEPGWAGVNVFQVRQAVGDLLHTHFEMDNGVRHGVLVGEG